MNREKVAAELVKLAKGLISVSEHAEDVASAVSSVLKLRSRPKFNQKWDETEIVFDSPMKGVEKVVVAFSPDSENVSVGIYPVGNALFFEDAQDRDVVKAAKKAARKALRELKRIS